VVEIDESKFFRRKYHRGQWRAGHWVSLRNGGSEGGITIPKKIPTLSGGGTLPAIEELENEIQRNISEFEMCTQTDTSQKRKINELCSYSFHICGSDCCTRRLLRWSASVLENITVCDHPFYPKLLDFFNANLEQLSFQKQLRN
jgi:hypothetical protein